MVKGSKHGDGAAQIQPLHHNIPPSRNISSSFTDPQTIFTAARYGYAQPARTDY